MSCCCFGGRDLGCILPTAVISPAILACSLPVACVGMLIRIRSGVAEAELTAFSILLLCSTMTR